MRDWEYTDKLTPREGVVIGDAWGAGIRSLKPQPGEVCPVCDRRVNRPRKPSSPEARKLKAGVLPNDQADVVEDGIDALEQYANRDGRPYPRGQVVAAAVVIAMQQREEVLSWLRRQT